RLRVAQMRLVRKIRAEERSIEMEIVELSITKRDLERRREELLQQLEAKRTLEQSKNQKDRESTPHVSEDAK
ncbi:MAG: hypothetical protein Q9224_004684, partial [Gallowayella concinna]